MDGATTAPARTRVRTDACRNLVRALALVALVALLAACGGGGDDDAKDAADTHGSEQTAKREKSERATRHDPDDILAIAVTADLSGTDGPFPTFDDAGGSGSYGGGVYTLVTKPAGSKTVSGYGQEDFGGTSWVRAGIDSAGAPADSGFGVVCRMQPEGRNYYRFGVGNDGTYSIAVVEDDDATLLTSDDQFWSDSDLIDEDARSFDIRANCDGDTLELYVDDELVDSVTDDTFTSGAVGVFSATFDDPNASIAVTAFDASGVIDDIAVPTDVYDSWRRFYRSTPAEITRCDVTDAAASELRPTPQFFTNCNGVQYAQMADADEAERAFGQLVDSTGADVRAVRGFPDCRLRTDVLGALPESQDLPVSGRVACIEQGDQLAVIWWNDAGIVGATQIAPGDADFEAGWAADWWPFTPVQKPGGEE